METVSKSLEETEILARNFIKNLQPSSTARVVGLRGDLGAGKTAFTQAAARALGITENVVSPTFVIEKIYDLGSGQRFARFIHIDGYRLDTAIELEHLGWREIVADPANLIFIEWPERVQALWPDDIVIIDFKVVDATSRNIMIP